MRRRTVVCASVFLFLLGALWFQSTHQRERGVTRVSLDDVNMETIDRIEIVGAKPVTLSRVNQHWYLEGGREADQKIVDRLLATLGRIDSVDLVSRSPERHGELQVDKEQGIAVLLYTANTKLVEFVVGKAGRGGSFVRFDDAVYLVKRVYAGTFARKASLWANRKLFTMSGEEIKRLDVKPKEGVSYTLLYDAEQKSWRLDDPRVLGKGVRFDSQIATGLASSFAG